LDNSFYLKEKRRTRRRRIAENAYPTYNPIYGRSSIAIPRRVLQKLQKADVKSDSPFT
jgi:hypothetical protein